MQAAILSIGDELVLGQTVDTNSAYLSAQLASRGIMTLLHQTVADDMQAMVDMIQYASERVELIIISGGLGPTDDDLTRQALAGAMGVELVMDNEQLPLIEAIFTRRGKPMPDRNKIQAYHPVGTTMITNTCGTAPGIIAKLNKATIYVTPGVPSEMKTMWDLSILPQIIKLAPSKRFIHTLKVNTFGRGESTIAEELGELFDRTRNPKVGTTVSKGIVSVRIRSEFETDAKAKTQLNQTVDAVKAKLGAIAYSTEDITIQEVLVQMLIDRKLTVATAESCTGGLIAKFLTDIPGSSSVVKGGWVTYANEMKVRELGVPQQMLMDHGAVSQPVALHMAKSAQEQANSDLAVSVTGIAGPGGGSDEKPVGTVWMGIADRKGATCRKFVFNGTRETIRDRTAKMACQMLRMRLLGEDDAAMTIG
ncbi:MAG TPA: competence/damage-inducible protein A [Phycisphaerales bacterium]|nr:competence/damage-inducible protein A [Phycisphaerales bacterium]HCD34117.1 competence/damage-inducible protein A [Phycisphaerales bacterium]|tara:strand:- start:786 stop:2051 length:1266 start_codon:yes stop_codon:yes gene_type:complete